MTQASPDEPELDFEPEALIYARKKAGYTKREAAKQAGISEQYWGDLEAGRRNTRPGTLLTIAETLNCPVVILERKREFVVILERKPEEEAQGDLDASAEAAP